eukprot:342897_1
MANSQLWESLFSCSFDNYESITIQTGLNDREFILISYGFLTTNSVWNKTHRAQIYSFTHNKVWKKWTNTPRSSTNLQDHISAIDKKNKKMYINDHNTVWEINLTDQTYRSFKQKHNYKQRYAAFVIEGKFHVFTRNYIFIWDPNSNNKYWDRVRLIDPFSCMPNSAGIVYVSHLNQLLIIGGKLSTYTHDTTNEIYSFSINNGNRKHNRIQLTLPLPAYGFGYAITNDERYVIILGGMTTTQVKLAYTIYGGGGGVTTTAGTNNIYVFDIRKMHITKSKVICPMKGKCKAIIPTTKQTDELTVFGYVRNVCSKSDFVNFSYPPMCLIALISAYYQNEYLHLIKTHYSRDPEHWRIKLDHILNGL